jgi:hypothetical protein
MSKIGIAVTANNIDLETIKRFRNCAQQSMATEDILEITQIPTFGPYNKSRHINDCLRKLLEQKCDIIVQTDIDMKFPKELMEETRQKTVPGTHFWVPCIKDGKVHYKGKGSWNALRVQDWINLGGYDERCFTWGFEDNDFHIRCNSTGYRRIEGKIHPIHQNHPVRSSWNQENAKKQSRSLNKKILKTSNFVNYLTDSLPKMKGVTIHLTSRCNRKCQECCLQDFLNINSDYCMSEHEIDNFVQAMELSPYSANRVIISGGEPLLCPTLPYAIKKLNACNRIHKILLYTGLINGFDITSLPKFRGTIRVSRYGNNELLLQDALLKDPTIQVIDKIHHQILPNKIFSEIVPGKCYNPEILVYDGRVYTCPMVAQNLIRYKLAPFDSPLYSEPLTNRFFDRLRGWHTGGMKACGGCAGNTSLNIITGKRCNN